MNPPPRQLRIIFSVLGLICVVVSIALIFVAPGTFWNWAALLAALVFMFLARRAAR